MKQIAPSEFLSKAEAGTIVNIFAVDRRVYGLDFSYDYDRAKNGKICEMAYADV